MGRGQGGRGDQGSGCSVPSQEGHAHRPLRTPVRLQAQTVKAETGDRRGTWSTRTPASRPMGLRPALRPLSSQRGRRVAVRSARVLAG